MIKIEIYKLLGEGSLKLFKEQCFRGENIWIQASKHKKIWIFLCFYTILFLITFLFVYSPFWLEDKSFIWVPDGHITNFPALVYIQHYLKQIILNLLHGKFSIPLFDLNIGAGNDIISTLNYYGFGDPLYLLSIFVPIKYTEFLYNFLSIFRVYLAGISFCALCYYQKKQSSFILIGALIYTYSGYAIHVAIRHPYFVNPMIQLPLLIIGIDLIIKHKKPYLFIINVFYSALCGFYFLYMMTIMLGLYTLAQFFKSASKRNIKEFIQIAGRIIGNYLLGIGLSAILFIPAVIGFLSSSRSGQSTDRNYFSYGWSYYRSKLFKLVAPPGSWNTLSLAAIVLFALTLLFFLNRKKYSILKQLFIVSAIFYVLPLGGHIMNGFSYPSQRWTFGFVLLLSYIVVEMMPCLLNLNKKSKQICVIILIAYIIGIFISSKNRSIYHLVGAVMLSITLIVLLLFNMAITTKGKLNQQTVQRVGVFACTVLIIGNVSVNAIYKFAKDQDNYVGEFEKYGVETEQLESALVREAKPYLKKHSERVDSSSSFQNTGMVWHVPTCSSLWSIINRHVADLWMKTENIQLRDAESIFGTDQRTIMSTLLSTQYFIEKENRTSYIPFGYLPVSKTENENLVYENQYSLPWGYTYDSYTSYNELIDLNGLEVEESMLQSIALEEHIDSIPYKSIERNTCEIPYEVVKMENISWEDGNLKVAKNNAVMTLSFQMPRQVEGYLRLAGFNINDSGQSSFYVTVECGDIRKKAKSTSSDYNWYYGRENYLYNLGYSDKERNSCSIIFPQKGVYKLKEIELLALPMNKYSIQVEKLRAEPLKNIEWRTNKITGTVDLSQNKILCMSIPYSRGWSAKVDGQPMQILRGNIMFMALPLVSGHHEIEFTYCTPGLKIGIWITIISIIILVLCIFRDRKS